MVFPLFGLNYTTRHEQIIVLWKNKVLWLSSACALTGEKGFFCQSPTYKPALYTASVGISCRALCSSMLYLKNMTAFTSWTENTRNSTLKALKAWLEVFFSRARKPPRAHTKHRPSLFHSALCYITHPPSSTSPCFVPLTIAVQWSEGMELAKHQPERWPGEKNYKKCVFV